MQVQILMGAALTKSDGLFAYCMQTNVLSHTDQLCLQHLSQQKLETGDLNGKQNMLTCHMKRYMTLHITI